MAYRVPRYDEGRDYKPRSPLTVQLERLRHSMLGCIIALNVLVFLVLKILVLCGLEQPVNWTSLNGSFSHFVTKPWGLLTYMFVHIDVIHLLFNMMWLWAFGAIIMRFDGPKPLLRSYIFSGIGGAICFLFATMSILGTSYLYGASAAVLGVVAYAAVRNGRQSVQMVLFGTVQIRWIALVAIVLCIIAGGTGNIPALAAHAGGAISGAIVAIIQKYKQSGQSSATTIHHIFKTPAKKTNTAGWRPTNVRQHQRRGLSETEQAEFDALLVKVRKIGYNNMQPEDRRRLFELSSHIK